MNFYSFAVVGGAVYTNGDLEVYGCDFSSCRASSSGGALFAHRTLTVTNSTFRNTSSGSFGGAGAVGNFLATPGDIVLIGVSVEGSTATLDGGAFYSENNIYVADSNFTSVSAGRNGGAIFGYRQSDKGPTPGEVVVERCMFDGAHAAKNGGGIYSSGIRASVTECRFHNTSAQVLCAAAGPQMRMSDALLAGCDLHGCGCAPLTCC